MNLTKVAAWTLIGLFCLFLVWLGGLVLNIGLGLIGAFMSLLGVLFSLAFSKFGLAVTIICLVIYILNNRAHENRYEY